MELKLDPWGAVHVDDYSKLFVEFGISNFDQILSELENPHPYMRRKIIFGHRGYEPVLAAMQKHDAICRDERLYALRQGPLRPYDGHE